MSEEEEDTGGGGALVPMDGDLINLHEETNEETRTFTHAELDELGIPAPLADPQTMRALYVYRRQQFAATLDREHDFLYTIAYQEQGKNKEKMTTSYKEALKFSETYKVPYKAVPKKTGIAKLATAYGVVAEIVEQRGLPIEPNANYSYVKYKVTAKRSGVTAVGIGFCRRDERGYPMPEHHMMGVADTRAYGRAILRLVGFGEAGAEEIGDEVVMPIVRIEQGPTPKRLPTATQAEVLDVATAPQEIRVPVPIAATPAPAKAAPVAAPVTAPARVVQAPVDMAIPSAAPPPSTITEAQVGKLSVLLREKLGSIERAKAWLMTEAKVNTTRAVPEAAYAELVKKLEALEAP